MYVNIKLKVLWQFKNNPEYKVTKCKKIINIKTNKIISYSTRGFYIKNRYVKRSEINSLIEPVVLNKNPF